MKGWVGLLGWPGSGRFTHISGHWSPISCRLSVGQEKFTGHRSTFYHSATQPTNNETWKAVYFGVKRSKSRGTKTRLCRCSGGTQYQRLLLDFPCITPVLPMLLTAAFMCTKILAVSKRRHGSRWFSECRLLPVTNCGGSRSDIGLALY